MPYNTVPHSPSIPVEPYRITADESVRTSLEVLLKHTRIPKATYENTQTIDNFGISRQWVVDAVKEWADIDWSRWEEKMNSAPQFMARVDGRDGREYEVQFMALFSKRTDAKPLVLLHGWPGCFLEFLPMFELLKGRWSEDELPYHLVVPSLPGWGYSSPPPLDTEFAVQDMSYLVNGLMRGLGFGKYIAQGGDIGSMVSVDLAVRHKECTGESKLLSTLVDLGPVFINPSPMRVNLLALHINFRYMNAPPKGTPEAEAQGKNPPPGVDQLLSGFQKYGYALEHGTRPATVGIAVGCNPVSLLAWIGEKYLEWSDQSPSLETILDIATLYWVTDTYPSSIYTYRYLADGQNVGVRRNERTSDSDWISKPLGYSLFKHELAPTPIHWVEKTGNMVWSKYHKEGGHFAALERPDELWADVEEFIDMAWDLPAAKD